MISWPLVRYALTAAFRDRLIPSLLAVMAIGACVSIVLGSAAIVESGQFAVVFIAGSLRFIAVLGLVLFVVFHLRRSFETKDVEYLLSRPVGRTAFILSHAAAFFVLAVVMACAVTGIVLIMTPPAYYPTAFLWGASVAAELVIMVSAALFFAMVLTSAASGVLATLGLYTLARLMGELLGTIEHDLSSRLMQILGVVMQAVSLIVPRLDLMAQTSWIVYGQADISLGFIALQAVIYSAFILAAASIDLNRRQF